jgi:deoxyribose-phosphate aldolase
MTDAAFARRAIGLIDLTDLSDNCRPSDIERLCRRSLDLPVHVAALCIWPPFVTQARAFLTGSDISLATVVNFPHGGENIAATCKETETALTNGADEIDLVFPWRAFLAGQETVAHDMISAVARLLPAQARLKVILESGEMGSGPSLRRASVLAIDAGADFLKTSTGKTKISATPEAARIMLEAIAVSGKPIGFKASGGLRTIEQARLYLDLADAIMGPGWARKETFRFGASSLLDPLLEAL